PVMAVIDRKDRDLGRQLRRCSASVGQNLAEGMYVSGEVSRGARACAR
ncbi:MAG: four helix bundle protein, partial [Sorangiineae bacterium PRO1]|nr:four helix bundle protein [Sorangiineae bacterium PRO1]